MERKAIMDKCFQKVVKQDFDRLLEVFYDFEQC